MTDLDERDLIKKARAKDAGWYLSWAASIVLGGMLFPLFSFTSLIVALSVGVWAYGIMRKSANDKKRLFALKPELDKLISEGMQEDKAIKMVNAQDFFFDPWWHVELRHTV